MTFHLGEQPVDWNEYYDIEGDIKECTTNFNYVYGKGFYKEIYFENVHIGYSNASLTKNVSLSFQTDLESIEMHFAIKGRNTAFSKNFTLNVHFSGLQHNIIYGYKIEGTMEWASEDFELLEINLSPVFFKRFLTEDKAIFENLKRALESKSSTLAKNEHSQISFEMFKLINEILNCNRKGLYKRVFLEAKILELLLLQLEQMGDENQEKSTLTKSVIEKMHAVKEFILGNIHDTKSLTDLAHLVGTNEFTLKRGFKELFGTTVFGFWGDVKMEHAQRLLLDSEMNINEISDSVGYKNPRHFSAAFKRKYGFIPSKLRKSFKE